LPHGSTQDAVITNLLGERTLEALTPARGIERVTMTESAARHWAEIYTALAEGAPGLLGAITNRAEAQTIRLALVLGRLADLHQATRRSGCLFNHLVGEREQLVRNLEAERLRGLEIDD
jgi:hypothetical protein